MTDPGPFDEQTRQLVEGIQRWTQRNFPAPPSGHGGPECQWCPLCQIAAALRGDHPELTERIAEAGAAVANALRSLTESAPTPPRGGARGPHTGRPGRPGADGSVEGADDTFVPDSSAAGAPPPRRGHRPRPRIEHIDLTDAAADDATDAAADAAAVDAADTDRHEP